MLRITDDTISMSVGKQKVKNLPLNLSVSNIFIDRSNFLRFKATLNI